MNDRGTDPVGGGDAAGGGSDPADWTEADLAAVRELYGRVRYHPADLDPSTLVAALSVPGRYRSSVGAALAAYADHDPLGVADHQRELLAAIDDDYAQVGPLGWGLGRAATADRTIAGALADRLAEDPSPAAAEGLAVAAEQVPGAVTSRVEAPLSALDAPDPIREPAIDALAALYVAGSPDGEVRLRVRGLLDASDRERRGAGGRVVALAAADGCSAAEPLLETVVDLLDSPLGGWASVVGDLLRFETVRSPAATRSAIREDLLDGLEAVARSRPGLLSPYLRSVAGTSVARDQEDRVEAVLAGVAAADRAVFTALLDRISTGGLVDRARRQVDGADQRRVAGALAGAADEWVGVLADRGDGLLEIADAHPAPGYRMVETLARNRPGAAGWAVEPLLTRVDRPWSSIDAAGAAFEALGALAPAHPAVAERLTDRLRTRKRGTWAATVAAVRGVAATAPETLLDRTDQAGAPVGHHLGEALSTDGVGREAALALAHLGIRSPAAVAPVAGDVADRIRTRSSGRATYVLASVIAHGHPESMTSLGYTVLDRFEPGTDSVDDGVVLLLGALSAGHDRYAGRILEALEGSDGSRRSTLLRVVAEGAWPDGTAVADYRPALAAATRTDDDEHRAVATKALSSAVAAAGPPERTVVDRLAALLYDPDPAVRRWAAFGVGEALAAGVGGGDALDRLSTVAAEDDAPAADLALVRAGGSPRTDRLETLERAARVEYRAIARTAVDGLAAAGDAGPLRSIRYDHVDPWVRAAAADAVDRA